MFEVLEYYRADIEADSSREKLGLEAGGYFLVSCHREENVDSDHRLKQLADVLNAVAQDYSLPILLSAHPRTRARLESTGVALDERVRVMKPFGFISYCALQRNARAVLSDSGTISEEAAILGLAAVNIRDAHERPEAMENGVAIMSGLSSERVLQALGVLDRRRESGSPPPRIPADYAVTDVSAKIVTIILSYTDYVRRTVWGGGARP